MDTSTVTFALLLDPYPSTTQKAMVFQTKIIETTHLLHFISETILIYRVWYRRNGSILENG